MAVLFKVYILFGLCSFTLSQVNIRSATKSLDNFALRLLAETSTEASDSLNIALAPYVIWTILGVINEGAKNTTERQISSTLGIQREAFRQSYKYISNNITKPTPGINLTITNAIFVPQHNDIKLLDNFKTVTIDNYDVKVENFEKTETSLHRMNKIMAQATNYLVQDFFNKNDLENVEVLLGSAFFFKGTWTNPFNKSKTEKDTFYNERGDAVGEVKMMYQAGPFPYTIVNSLSAIALELPYGVGDKISMVILLPRKGTSLNKVLRTLSTSYFEDVLDSLNKAAQEYLDEDVQVYLPKFKISSDLTLNKVLDSMGIRDLFNAESADLTGMFNHYLWVSRLVQRAVIEVDEEGTVAAAVASASFTNKSPPPVFKANRPFAYFIVDKPTKTILFTGKLSNPYNIG